MRIARPVAVAVLCFGARARCQAPIPAMGPSDSLQVSENIYARLFQAIDLSKENHDEALRVIRATYLKMLTMHAENRTEWEQFTRVEAQRDSILASLVTDPKQRAEFKKRAAEEMPKNPRFGGYRDDGGPVMRPSCSDRREPKMARYFGDWRPDSAVGSLRRAPNPRRNTQLTLLPVQSLRAAREPKSADSLKPTRDRNPADPNGPSASETRCQGIDTTESVSI